MSSQNLEKRIVALETEVERLRQAVEGRGSNDIPWWDRIAGTFANDPIYDEAMRLGRKWRESTRPDLKSRRKKT